MPVRRRVSFFAVAWLMVAGVLASMAAVSFWRVAGLAYTTPEPQLESLTLDVERGSVWLMRTRFILGLQPGWRADWGMSHFGRELRLGVRWGSSVFGQHLSIPIWPVCAASTVFAWWFQRRHRRWLNAAGENRCIACGYDLRATPTRCPECGRAVGPSTKGVNG